MTKSEQTALDLEAAADLIEKRGYNAEDYGYDRGAMCQVGALMGVITGEVRCPGGMPRAQSVRLNAATKALHRKNHDAAASVKFQEERYGTKRGLAQRARVVQHMREVAASLTAQPEMPQEVKQEELIPA